ncbi:ROK family protein [Longispora urticae]
MIVFDLGGTSFRSGIVTDGALHDDARSPAISYLARPEATIADLQAALIDYLTTTARALAQTAGCTGRPRVGLSFGAALNGATGFVWNNGPLWGPLSRPFDLPAALAEAAPEFDWSVINDVTAALFGYLDVRPQTAARRVCLVTVSTGIAARTAELPTRRVALDAVNGMQGEIGHLPVRFAIDGVELEEVCDCGGSRHLNAYASGRGMARILRGHAPWLGVADEADDAAVLAAFAVALREGDQASLNLLDAFTRPMAEVLGVYLTVDPEVEEFAFTGGVARTLGPVWLESLLGQMHKLGVYQALDIDPDHVARRLRLAGDSDDLGLLGAASYVLATAATKGPDSEQHLRVGPGPGSWTVTSERPATYTVRESEGALFDPANGLLEHASTGLDGDPRRRMIVIDAQVDALHGAAMRAWLAARGFTAHIEPIALTEQTKGPAAILGLVDAMRAGGLHRRDTVIAIGGGVLLDVAGLAAGLYRRGTPYVRVPTTLLGYVDASVGVKTAVNYGDEKSLIGAYHPPATVLLDRSFLATVDDRHIRNGLGEIVKVAIVRDAVLFADLENHGARLAAARFQPAESVGVLRRAVHVMLSELAPNLFEQHLNRRMDAGHTFSGVLEMQAAGELLHGEAVAIDLAVCATLSLHRRLLDPDEYTRVINLITGLGLAVTHAVLTPKLLVEGLAASLRHRGGQQRQPLPAGIGKSVFANDLTETDLRRAFDALTETAAR